MPALMIYLIKVNAALLIFCGGYYAVLRRLTFYNLNRWYLVSAIVVASVYPLLDVSAFVNSHKHIADPVQAVAVNWQAPVNLAVQSLPRHDVWFWGLIIFWTGAALFAVRLLTQLFSLYRLHKRSQPAQFQQYAVRMVKSDINPFSFWQNIYINPQNHPQNELPAILEHEQVHVNEWHTLDILLGEISAVFYWFNPGIWLMKRAIRENIEFITDHKILQQGVDSKSYQYSLLHVNLGGQNNALVNNFNLATIKKRIIMMNAKRSAGANITRYIFLVPAILVLLLVFSISKAELKKSATARHLYKAITIAVGKVALSHPSTVPALRPQMSKLTVSMGKFVIQYDTIPKAKGITITTTNNGGTSVRVSGNSQQSTIYLNGVKTGSGLQTIDPENILSIDVIKSDTANPNGAIYIVTKQSAGNGKLIFKHGTDSTVLYGQKIKLNQVSGQLLVTSVDSAYTFSTGQPYTRLRIIDSTHRLVTGHPIVNLRIKDSSHVFVTGKPITKMRINGTTLNTTSKKIVVNGDTVYSNTYVYSTGKGATMDSLMNRMDKWHIQANTIFSKNGQVYTATSPDKIFNSARPISFANKLILIDGKEATEKEMKKLSADKIETISVLKDDAAVAKYGTKAKNGIVVITTKNKN